MNIATKKAISKAIYLKLCWNRAWSHVAIPLTIAEKVLILAVFLKVFNINNYLIIGIISAIGIIALFFLGHLDLKKGIADMEISLFNNYNPEMQKLLKK